MARPQTLQIFLPAGDPRVMRAAEAEITKRIVRVIEVLRRQWGEIIKTPVVWGGGVRLRDKLFEAGCPASTSGSHAWSGLRSCGTIKPNFAEINQ